MIIRVLFPKTEAGLRAFRDFLRTQGFRDIYPDGSTLADVDWDAIACEVDEYMTWRASNPDPQALTTDTASTEDKGPTDE